MTKILLTGATGVLGVEVCDLLLRTCPDLNAIVLSRRQREIAASSGFRYVRANLLDWNPSPSEAAELFGDVTHIIHMAADVRWNNPLEKALAINSVATSKLAALACQYARHLKRMVYVSTAFIGCAQNTETVDEQLDLDGQLFNNTYEYSKFRGEEDIRASGLPHSIVRCSLIVGNQHSGKISSYNGLYHVLRNIARGLVPFMVGYPDALIDIVPADFVAQAVIEATFDGRFDGATIFCASGKTAPSFNFVLNTAVEGLNECRVRHSREPASVPPLVSVASYKRLYKPMLREALSDSTRRSVQYLELFFPYLCNRVGLEPNPEMVCSPVPDAREYYSKCIEHWCLDNVDTAVGDPYRWRAKAGPAD
jgi:nucleoside-diphosphate-sugar epimerase